MRIWHLGRHEEFEMVIEIDVAVSDSDLHDSSLRDVLLLEQDRVNRWIDRLLDVLHEQWLASPDRCCDISQESLSAELEQQQIVVSLEVLDPFVGLLLWVNAESIPLSLGAEDTVFA